MSDLPETILSRPPTGPPVSSNADPFLSADAVPPVPGNAVSVSENAVPDAVVQDISLKRRLLDILRRTDAAEQIAGALIREASGAGKATSVIRAIEEVREIIGNALDGPDAVQPDWSSFSDTQLMEIIRGDASGSMPTKPESVSQSE